MKFLRRKASADRRIRYGTLILLAITAVIPLFMGCAGGRIASPGATYDSPKTALRGLAASVTYRDNNCHGPDRYQLPRRAVPSEGRDDDEKARGSPTGIHSSPWPPRFLPLDRGGRTPRLSPRERDLLFRPGHAWEYLPVLASAPAGRRDRRHPDGRPARGVGGFE